MYDVGIMGNGALAGLVAITSGTSTIEPWGAIIVGFVAGALYILGSKCSVWFKVLPAASLPAAHLPGCLPASQQAPASLQTAAMSEDAELRASDHCHHACLNQCMQCAGCGHIP